MDSPKVVDTSDVEEEVLVFSGALRLSSSLPSLEGIRASIVDASPRTTITENGQQWYPSSSIVRHDRAGDREAESPSPRKRIKLAHNPGSVSSDSTRPMAVTSSPRSRLPDVVPTEQISSSPSKHSQGCMLGGEVEEQSSTPLEPPSSLSLFDYHSLFSSPHEPQCDSPDVTGQLRSQNMESSSISQPYPHSLSRSLSTSSDAHSLFSTPCRLPTTPQTSSQHSHDQPTSSRQEPHFVASSPLTPMSSPALLSQPLPQPNDPIQLLPPRQSQAPRLLASQSTPPPFISRPVCSPPVEIPEDPQPLARYSLRRREARQLNPYAYDRLLYKQQLKSHPDAIVKFRSPRRYSEPGWVRGDGTQDDFVIPTDNPDEDADYVGVEGGNGRRRCRVQSLDQTEELGEDGRGLGQAGDGWLPDALKELSSSDEDDHEIQKLVRSIRREQKKAAAEAKAEAERAAAEPRQVEVETSKPAKKRPKPFPVHEFEDIRLPEHISRVVPSPTSSVFSRAPLEAAMVSYPSSSGKSPLEPLVLYQASSHSQTSSSGSVPDFRVDLQQEDSHQSDDHDHASFLRNRSPVDHSISYSTPPSPSWPPVTSDTSALSSNTSRRNSESDQSSVLEMSSKDRRRLRALRHMMPAAMIARQFGTASTAHPRPPRARTPVESPGSGLEEAKIMPWVARVRKGRYKDVEVRGDPESSDTEPVDAYDNEEKRHADLRVDLEMLSDGQSAVGVSRMRYASPKSGHENTVISLSDNSTMSGSSEDSGGDDESFFDPPTRGPVRERSLIDWMLTRTRSSGRPKSRKATGQQKSRRSGAPKLDIVTSGAKRYGGAEHHQTLLPFVRANASSNTTSSIKHNSRHQDRIVQFDRDTAEDRKKGKKKGKQRFGPNQGSVYNINYDATRITSKNREVHTGRGRATLVIEHDDSEFRQALDPGWRAEVERWNKSISPRQPAAKQTTSAPTASRSRLYRRTSPRPRDEISLPHYFQRGEEQFPSIQRRVVIDMNITPLPSGVKFGTSSYLGKGLLYRLILTVSGNGEVAQPTSCNMQGLEIGPTTSAAIFSDLLGPLCDRLTDALRGSTADNVDTTEWDPVTCAWSQFLSWLAVHSEDQEFAALEGAIKEYSNGLMVALDSLDTSTFTLAAYWFVVELAARLAAGVKYRRGSAENGHLFQSAKQLVQRLLGVDLQPTFTAFHATEGDIDDDSLPHRAAELWICLIHLLPNFELPVSGHSLWHLLADLYPETSPTGAVASEDLWRTIFSLCAISQCSVHGMSTSIYRLPAAWELVAVALKKIVLTADPEKERQLSQRVIKKRDDYVSYVVSRCFLLWNRWEWRLDDGIVMFKSLQEIFRSRNFASLLHERSTPMGFLENSNLELLTERDPHDTVFEVFLKMVVQAVNLLNANAELDPKQRSVNIKKLLQMAVPVSPVPFSHSAPPSTHSVSMLVNRFSAMTIAIHLDPTSSNVKFRIGQARRCLSFKDADDQSRVACVYGMMNFAMIVRHHKIDGGLKEVLGWLGEMADILMDEYKEGEPGIVKTKTTTLIQLLIGSVRRVIETQSLDKGQSRAEYPDPSLLDGPWVTRVFNPRTDLVTIQQTGLEIRMLVQSFLNARLKAVPAVQPPPPPVVHGIESQESQDEFDKLFLNDEELLAALGAEAEASTVTGLKSKEDALCKVLDKSITPAVYRLVCKNLSEGEHAKDGATNAQAVDEWIDCWVGCANVLVQNNYKDWSLYMKLGQQSWEKIIDDSWRRRVGLRFNLTLLRLDPRAYSKTKDDFIAVLLVAIVSCRVTIEHEFVGVVASLDGLQHPLLRDAPLEPIPGTRKYEVIRADYEAVRGQLIETVFANVAGHLRASVDAESQAYVEMVVVMLSTMRDIYQGLTEKAEYGDFCRRVFRMLSGQPELTSHPRLSGALGWGRREWPGDVY